MRKVERFRLPSFGLAFNVNLIAVYDGTAGVVEKSV